MKRLWEFKYADKTPQKTDSSRFSLDMYREKKREREIHLQSDHILSIDFADLVVSEQSVTSCRAVLHYRRDSAFLKDETELAGHVLMQRDSTLQWPAE